MNLTDSNDIERFLAAQKLHRCEPMNSNLTNQHCQNNKKSGRYISCSGCVGLGEKIEMGKTMCIIKGCDKWAQIGGKCKAHAKGTTPRAARAVTATAQAEPVKKQTATYGKCVKCQTISVALGPGNLCHSCRDAERALLGMDEKPVEKQEVTTSNEVEKPEVLTSKVNKIATEETGRNTVSVAEQRELDEISYLRSLLDEVLSTWSNDLHDAKNPRDRAKHFLGMCEAAEGLGY